MLSKQQAEKFLVKRGHALGERLKLLRSIVQDMHDEALTLIKDKLKYGGLGYTIGTVWSCPKSPLGLCVYDHLNDHVHDFCVFCNHPEERK